MEDSRNLNGNAITQITTTRRGGVAIIAAAAIALGCSSVAEAAKVKLLQTGQTVCYDFNDPELEIDCDETGQDGEFQNGVELSYKDDGDGTIKDKNTKLQWEKKSNDGSIHDVDNLYTWPEAFERHIHTLNNMCENDETVACSYDKQCKKTVGGRCGFAGKRDWRLPNVRELASILNFEIPDLDADPPLPRVSEEFNDNCVEDVTVFEGSCLVPEEGLPYTYWTSTSGDAIGDAYFVDFETADIGAHGKDVDEEFENIVVVDDEGVPIFELNDEGMPVFMFEEERAFAGYVRAVRGGLRRKHDRDDDDHDDDDD